MFRDDKKHNAEDVRFKARPLGCARNYDVALACIEWVNIQFNATEALSACRYTAPAKDANDVVCE